MARTFKFLENLTDKGILVGKETQENDYILQILIFWHGIETILVRDISVKTLFKHS